MKLEPVPQGYTPHETFVLSDPALGDGEPKRSSFRLCDRAMFWRAPSRPDLEASISHFTHHSFRPHTHDGLMVGLIDEGVKTFQRERARFWAEPGSISVVNAGDLHTGERADGAILRYRALYLPISALTDAAGSSRPSDVPGFLSGVVHDADLYSLLGYLHSSIVEGATSLTLEQCLTDAVLGLVTKHSATALRRASIDTVAPIAIRAAQELLQTRYHEDLTVAEISLVVGLSPFHLMRQFRRYFGMPMHTYQTQLRVEKAKHLLKSGMSVVEVALAVGFADQSHFTKRFKERVGTPPGLYMRQGMSSAGNQPDASHPLSYPSLRSV